MRKDARIGKKPKDRKIGGCEHNLLSEEEMARVKRTNDEEGADNARDQKQ